MCDSIENLSFLGARAVPPSLSVSDSIEVSQEVLSPKVGWEVGGFQFLHRGSFLPSVIHRPGAVMEPQKQDSHSWRGRGSCPSTQGEG